MNTDRHRFLTRRTAALLSAAMALAPVSLLTGCSSSSPVSQRQPTIIISGASGQLGKLTVAALLKRGVPASQLILVSRTPEQLADYAHQGAQVRYGDFTVPSSLPAAFAGGTKLLLISVGFEARPRPLAHQHAIDAAVAAGVRHIVYTSYVAISHGDTSGMIATDHYATEQLLKKSGIAWTVLRNSIYSDMLVPEAAKMLAAGRVTIPANDSPVGYVTRADCADAAAAALTTPGHENRIYDITGPALISLRDVAAAAGAIARRKIDIVAAGPADPVADRGYGGPAIAVISYDFRHLTGHQATSLESLFAAKRPQLIGEQPHP